jgi:uncharacterized protein (DUF2344 family)
MLDKTTKADQNGKPAVAMRIRAEFAKTEAMRFTSHLDLYRAWERLLRRAGLPLQFSQGYNPRPKLQLAAPLPLGMTSQVEIIDFWLSGETYDLDQIHSLIRHFSKKSPLQSMRSSFWIRNHYSIKKLPLYWRQNQ